MKKLLAICLLLTLAACTSLGLTPPQSFDQQVAYGYGTVTALRVSAAQALDTHTLSAADAQHVLDATDSARMALDAAESSQVSGDKATAATRLAAATSALMQLQQFLITKGVK